MSQSSFAVWGNIEVSFLAIYPACFIHWLLLLEQALGLENEHSKCTLKQIIIFNLYINLRASFNWQKFSALNLDWILIALMFMWFKKLFGALGLSGEVSFKNFFSTPIKIQFAEKLKLVFSKTSFQRKDHCLKGKQVVLEIFFVQSLTRFGQHALMCSSIPKQKSVASVEERMKGDLPIDCL